MSKKIIAYDIKWDIDEPGLPTSVTIPDGMEEEEEISDWLSDTYGFGHHGFLLSTETD